MQKISPGMTLQFYFVYSVRILHKYMYVYICLQHGEKALCHFAGLNVGLIAGVVIAAAVIIVTLVVIMLAFRRYG